MTKDINLAFENSSMKRRPAKHFKTGAKSTQQTLDPASNRRTNFKNFDSIICAFVHVPWIQVTGCCFVEIETARSSTYDWSRLGVIEMASSPEEADLLIIGGWINKQSADEIKTIYQQLGGTKSVLAIGACALSGSPYEIGTKQLICAKDIVPVDVFVPGCPPRPEMILDGIRLLQKKVSPDPKQEIVLFGALKGPLLSAHD